MSNTYINKRKHHMKSLGAKKKGGRHLETSQTPARGPQYSQTELASAESTLHTPQGSLPPGSLSVLHSTFQKNCVGQITPRPKLSSQADVFQHPVGFHLAVPFNRSNSSGSTGFNLQLIPLLGSAGSSCCLKPLPSPCLETLDKSGNLKWLF